MLLNPKLNCLLLPITGYTPNVLNVTATKYRFTPLFTKKNDNNEYTKLPPSIATPPFIKNGMYRATTKHIFIVFFIKKNDN